ncbi:MAG: diguanylate cyclase (GGDEF)-like protein [Flavobacteriales bacterium]|jgi:diguanylate cyclase (GGDEF)-like protein
MTFINKRRFKYYGLICLSGSIILILSTFFIHFHESNLSQYRAQIKRFQQAELIAINIQYSFKKQVQEWKNILIRGSDPKQYSKYHSQFISEFERTQYNAQQLIDFFAEENNITKIANEFQIKHDTILSKYEEALIIYKATHFDILAADEVVKGIDREPDELLGNISAYVKSDIAKKVANTERELLIFEGLLAFIFISIQLIVCCCLIQLTKKLLKVTLQDETTGLGNRALFVNSIDDHIRSNKKVLIGILDIDDFKIINETCGNLGGDLYLKQIGKIIVSNLPKGSEICRINADVIGFIIPTINNDYTLLTTITQCIADFEFSWHGLTTKLTCSIAGYDLNKKLDDTNEGVLNALYVSLQKAKSTGRNKVVFYNSKDDFIVEKQKQMRMVSHVSDALENKKIVLFRQAIIPVDSHSNLTYYEVLMRVKYEGDFKSPWPYLQAAESFHLITKIDRYIVTETVNYLHANTHETAKYSVNLSGQSLSDPKLPDFFDDLFKRTGFTPNRLGFEITETDLIQNFTIALVNVQYLRSKGCKISLDDFGTGMSSYAYLSELEIDTLKIDGTFIKGIDKDKQKQAIVDSMIMLSTQLGFTTVAEFVETNEEYATLKRSGIEYCQGYLLHKPELFFEP